VGVVNFLAAWFQNLALSHLGNMSSTADSTDMASLKK